MPTFKRSQLLAVVIQAIVLLLAAGGIFCLAQNIALNLRRQGIASGFDFLQREAGFSIIQHLIPYNEQSTYGRAFLVALLNTLVVSLLSLTGATFLGFGIGMARLSSNWLVARLALIYVEILRNVPLLLQLFFWYFAVLRNLPPPRASLSAFDYVFLNIRGLYVPRPMISVEEPGYFWLLVPICLLLGGGVALVRSRCSERIRRLSFLYFAVLIGFGFALGGTIFGVAGFRLAWEIPQLNRFNFSGGLTLLPEFVALFAALTTYTAAFIAEIVRAGILAVPRGQSEAAAALGLSHRQTLRYVILPQSMRMMLPLLTSQYLNLFKNSSLAAAIAYPDLVLVFAGTVLMQTGQAVEVMAITMVVFLLVSLSVSVLMNYQNRRVLRPWQS